MLESNHLIGFGAAGDSSTAHRYWRLYVSKMVAFGGTYKAAINEFELRGVVGGATLATDPARVSARSSNASYPPSNAVDVSPAWWLSDAPFSSASDYTWLAYEFAPPVSVAQYGVSHPYSTYAAAWQPTDFELQWSDDGATWTTVPSSVVVGESFTSDALKTYTL